MSFDMMLSWDGRGLLPTQHQSVILPACPPCGRACRRSLPAVRDRRACGTGQREDGGSPRRRRAAPARHPPSVKRLAVKRRQPTATKTCSTHLLVHQHVHLHRLLTVLLAQREQRVALGLGEGEAGRGAGGDLLWKAGAGWRAGEQAWAHPRHTLCCCSAVCVCVEQAWARWHGRQHGRRWCGTGKRSGSGRRLTHRRLLIVLLLVGKLVPGEKTRVFGE